MKQHHHIEVFLTIDGTVITRPDCETAEIFVGETVSFGSPHGDIEIEWSQNPFDKAFYKNGDTLRVTSAGPFKGACSVILPDGKRLNYKGGTEGKTQEGDTTATGG